MRNAGLENPVGFVREISNLPVPTTPFINRAGELSAIAAVLRDPTCRLLTLVGAGGVGKTRLALEAAVDASPRFRDGVYFVPLQDISTPAYLPGSVAEALRFPIYEAGDPKQQLINYLRDKQLLLLADNFEHVLDGATLIGDILANAPGVQILATSREALNLQEEWIHPVEGMTYPASIEELQRDERAVEDYSAIQLFAQTARRQRADFSLIEELDGVIAICNLVEGIPLALELAAGWVRAFSCREIAQEIERNLDFLETPARNVPSRHRSMRVVLEQTWSALTAAEQDVFKRLSVFRGGLTRAAAEAVAGASPRLLTALVSKSLLRHTRNEHYDLHELLRQFGAEQLALTLEEQHDAARRHCAFYMDLLRQRWARLGGSEQKRSLEEIEAEIDNIRLAWRWAADHSQTALLDGALDSLWFFYDTRSWYQEGERAFAHAAAALGIDTPPEQHTVLLGRVIARQASMLYSLNQPQRALELLQHSLEIFERHGERFAAAFSLCRLGEVEQRLGLPDTEAHFREARALYVEMGDRWWAAFCTYWVSHYAKRESGEDAVQMLLECLAAYEEMGNTWGLCLTYESLAWHAADAGDNEHAKEYGRRSLMYCDDIRLIWGKVLVLTCMGLAHFGFGEYDEALECLRRALRLGVENQLYPYLLTTLVIRARLMRRAGRIDQAVECLSLVLHHPMNWEVRLEAKGLLDKCRSSDPAIYDAAVARGQQQELVTYVTTMLQQWDDDLAQLLPLLQANTPAGDHDSLSERELEILRLVADGRSNREIADELVLSVGTVKWYLNQIYSKLRVNSRTQAVARARELALLS